MDTLIYKKKFRVGISGHRDLKRSEIAKYKNKIKNILNKLILENPDKEVFVITPLADGADRIMAECASELGIRYEVVMPMTLNLYIQDFNEASLSEFYTLHARAAGSRSLPLREGNTVEGIKQYGKERDRQYASVGYEIVDRSDAMVFVWDGKVNGLTGGTSDIIRYAKEKNARYFIVESKREKEERGE